MSDQKSSAPSAAGSNQKMVTELKVSGHLMALDTGLFCIFTAPGSPVPDLATGLPGVRVSLPSGPAFRPEAISISTFRDDGWLGGDTGAALVRVLRGPAQLLVTIYQAPNSTGDAPRLQILRLNDGTAQSQAMLAGAPQAARPQPAGAQAAQVASGKAALAPPASAKTAQPATGSHPAPQDSPAAAAQVSPEAAGQAEIVAHVQGRADVLAKLGDWMGEPGSKRWIEGFAIAPKSIIGQNDIEYQAVLGRGWLSPWAEGGHYCGSRGMSLPILGLRVRLRGEAADHFDCVVTASFTDGTRIGPLDNGEPCQAESLAPLEAFHVSITARGEAAAAMPEQAADQPKASPAKASAAKAAASPKPASAPAAPARSPAKPATARGPAATASSSPAAAKATPAARAAAKPAPAPAAKGRSPAAAPAAKSPPPPAPKGGSRGRR